MKLVLIGPPGAGKGTISEWLKTENELEYLSTGNLFREEKEKGTELGKLAGNLIDEGKFVPDDVTCDIVMSYIKNKERYILDGFPRTLFQARRLISHHENQNKEKEKILYFTVNDNVIVKRLSGRRVCSTCKSIYHIENHPPQVEGVCDKCGETLEQRKDDREEFIQTRLDAYKEKTKPVVDFYQKYYPHHMIQIDANKPLDELQEELRRELKMK